MAPRLRKLPDGEFHRAVTVANNHSMDYGANGYASTLAVLEQAGVPYVERDSTAVVTTAAA